MVTEIHLWGRDPAARIDVKLHEFTAGQVLSRDRREGEGLGFTCLPKDGLVSIA